MADTRTVLLHVPIASRCDHNGCGQPAAMVFIAHPLANGALGGTSAACLDHAGEASAILTRTFQVMNGLLDDDELTSEERDYVAVVKEHLA